MGGRRRAAPSRRFSHLDSPPPRLPFNCGGVAASSRPPEPCLGGSPIATHMAAGAAPPEKKKKKRESWLGCAPRSPSSGGAWPGSALPLGELSRPPPPPLPAASEPGAAARCRRSSPDRNCWVTLNFLNSELLAEGDITAWVSGFSAPSPLPRPLSPQCFAEFLRLFFFFF